MAKKWIYGSVAAVFLAAALTACGDGADENMSEETIVALESVSVAAESVNAEPENAMPDEIIMLCSTAALDEEKEEKVLEAMTTLYQNLEIPEYIGEGIHMVSSEEWLETMAQDLYEGCRSYTLQKGEQTLLSIQVGFDIGGEAYINICYQGNDGNLLLLKQAQGVTWLLQTNVSDGKYNGAFEVWQIDSSSGKIQREQGTYSNGIKVGECIQSEYAGVPGEAFDLWTNRENFAYESTTVTYDEQGEIVPTPTPEATATPKPTAKPAATPTPAPTATPAPTPAPPQEPDNGSDNSNNGGHVNTTPEPPQQPDSPPTTGDTDVDWSPDLM